MISHSRLKELLSYDTATGIFVRRVKSRTGPGHEGAVFGHRRQAYLVGQLEGEIYSLHHLAWFYAHGVWPEIFIDHINGNKLDNRLSNLRLATKSQNGANARRSLSNSSGFKGVDWHSQQRKWRARITVNGTLKFLGCFQSPEEAHAAYVAAAKSIYGDFACDGIRNNAAKEAA